MARKISDLVQSTPVEPRYPPHPTSRPKGKLFADLLQIKPVDLTKQPLAAARESADNVVTVVSKSILVEEVKTFRPALGPTDNLARRTPPHLEHNNGVSPKKSPKKPGMHHNISNDAAKGLPKPALGTQCGLIRSPSPLSVEQQVLHRPITRPPEPVFAQIEPWSNWSELTVVLSNVPTSFSTQRVHKLLLDLRACPVRIQVAPGPGRSDKFRKNTLTSGTARVRLSPPPTSAPWVRDGIVVPLTTTDGVKEHLITCVHMPEYTEASSSIKALRRGPNHVTAKGAFIEFGVMKEESKVLVMRRLKSHQQPRMILMADVQRQMLEMRFGFNFFNADNSVAVSEYNFKIPFGEIREVAEHCNAAGQVSFVISLSAPPTAFRRVSQSDVLKTHDTTSDTWEDRKAWFRVVGIEHRPRQTEQKTRITKLRNDELEVDIGRWLVYRFILDPSTSKVVIADMKTMLINHNIAVVEKTIIAEKRSAPTLWRWLEDASGKTRLVASSALLSDMSKTVQLSFPVQYQLEVCLSQGYLHECNIDMVFVRRLHDMEEVRAVKLLEKVAEHKRRYFEPMEIFRLQHHISSVMNKPPYYCTMVRSATVTPTTIVFNTPSVDTSNRIIRQYQQHEDRFLRVKFRDEQYKGTIMALDDDSTLELFTRVHRTMVNGIIVGDRHYEFLAFGNSQFREHGAYFFSPVPGLTARDIRLAMGNFEHIQVVAKYASRIGQCLSTTRAVRNTVTVERVEDIERNGHCFTDGVGKISQALAQMTVQEMGIAGSAENCPSVFQFRMGGCKGVLTTDPALKGALKVVIRPSQEKFPTKSNGFEICRFSQFATAYLNQQIVLVLSALGVPDNVFLSKLRKMLENLESAMTDPRMALDLLQKNIDLNQTTVSIAEMILSGFMAAKDPFTLSLLRLWRSWSIKYLKEKAKIFVDHGAFVLGVVDETRTLKGYTHDMPVSDSNNHDAGSLPEIFIQIPDPDHNGKFKVIEGVCTIARNPSLHPGDIRVVNAVDVLALRHLRNCLVLPQTGDRDLASMCSGGDLDGDDYLVMWDQDLLPREWNHEPMDYTAPPPKLAKGPITVEDITKFFVQHMRYDTLPRIAVAHRYWADKLEDGVKDEKCMQLAELHSKAVDYAKSGVPAEMPRELKVKHFPHWSDKKRNTYKSKRVLGKLYDETDRVPFVPAWTAPFDDRVLGAFDLDESVLAAAQEVKKQYDEAIRRIMAQHGVRSEFEVWSTFVLDHNHESRDFKIAEELGSTVESLKQQFKELCYEKAGTTSQERNESKLRPFVAAMYTVTAEEVAVANRQCNERKLVAGQYVPVRRQDHNTMPLISFPWLFQKEMGRIATKKQKSANGELLFRFPASSGRNNDKVPVDALGNAIVLAPLPEVDTKTELSTDAAVEDDPVPAPLFQCTAPSVKSDRLQVPWSGFSLPPTAFPTQPALDNTELRTLLDEHTKQERKTQSHTSPQDHPSKNSADPLNLLTTTSDFPNITATTDRDRSDTTTAASLLVDAADADMLLFDPLAPSTTANQRPSNIGAARPGEELRPPGPWSPDRPRPPPTQPPIHRPDLILPSPEAKEFTDIEKATNPGDLMSLTTLTGATSRASVDTAEAKNVAAHGLLAVTEDEDGAMDEDVKLEICGTGVDALDRLAALLG